MIPISRVWKHTNEPDRIHYVIRTVTGDYRHLYCDRGSPLFDVLAGWIPNQPVPAWAEHIS